MKALALAAGAALLLIGSCGGDAGSELADLISNAVDGDVIALEARSYEIEAGFESAKSITIRGAGADATIIEVVGSGDAGAGLLFTGAQFGVADVTFTQEADSRLDTLIAVSGAVAITNSHFTGARVGLNLIRESSGRVESSRFTANEFGLIIGGSSTVVVEGNIFSNNNEGIVADVESTATLRGNTITNSAASGILVQTAARPLVEGNTISTAGSGIAFIEGGSGVAVGNTIEATGFGLDVRVTEGVTLRENTVRGSETAVIFWVEATGGVAERNVCEGNTRDIVLMHVADPVLVDNQCEVLDER